MFSKVDKDKIAGWNQELVRLLHVFNVRSINFAGNFANLTALFQAELAIDTNIRVTDTKNIVGNTQMTVINTQTMVANTQTIAAGTQTTVANNQTIVADTQVTVMNIEKKVADMHLNMLPQDTGQADSCFLLTRAHITYSRLVSFEQLPSRASGRVPTR